LAVQTENPMNFEKKPLNFFRGVANTGLFTHKFLPQKKSNFVNETVKIIKEEIMK
jgi:hypothetical protein